MMAGSRNRWVVVAFVLAVSAGPAVKDATAGKKPKLVARVNNKGFRASLRASIVGAYSPAGVTLNGVSAHVGRHGGSIKTLTIACAVPITTATFPVTVDCAGAYTFLDSAISLIGNA